ncbi:flagellar basal-body rod protein FlgF [Derxia gummosa]|uniref:Flagellar basal-body rod protein FlgF n=1 Tax=Derxia gummosa DSM 723 TaxID=1121388 RepID=A0A8B6X7M0_9BURK|nr:flagellar basal-body rod protein FlgF [Derxia gummosa]
MDRLIYTAMTGARALFDRQATVSNNLANASTTGFRAELTAYRTAPVIPGRPGEGQMTRYMAVDSITGLDVTPGPLEKTERQLDVAINGAGWFTVQAADGSEAYTRDGRFDIDSNGQLVTREGLPVLGEGGPIIVPQDARVVIGGDGTISAVAGGGSSAQVQQLGRLQLVNPDPANLTKRPDGLIGTRDGNPADPDPTVRVAQGSIEGSNVNPVGTLVDMISLARQFEVQMQMIKKADENGQKSQQLLSNS